MSEPAGRVARPDSKAAEIRAMLAELTAKGLWILSRNGKYGRRSAMEASAYHTLGGPPKADVSRIFRWRGNEFWLG